MNRFIKIFSLTAFIAVASVASAQQTSEKPGKDQATEMTNKIDRRVTLTEDQRAEVLTLAADYFNQLKVLKKDKETFEDKKAILEETYYNKVKAILTTEQAVKFEAFYKERKSSK